MREVTAEDLDALLATVTGLIRLELSAHGMNSAVRRELAGLTRSILRIEELVTDRRSLREGQRVILRLPDDEALAGRKAILKSTSQIAPGGWYAQTDDESQTTVLITHDDLIPLHHEPSAGIASQE